MFLFSDGLFPDPEEGVLASVFFRRFVIFSRGPVPEPCTCVLLSVYSASWGVALLKLLALSRQREGGPGSSCPGPGGNHCLCHNNTPSRRAARRCAVVGRDLIARCCRLRVGEEVILLLTKQ